MFMNPKDAPFAVAMALLLLGLVRAFDRLSQPDRCRPIVLFGIGLGLTIGTRIIGGIGALYAAAGAALLLGAMMRARSGCALPPSGSGASCSRCCRRLVLAYAVMGLVWPWAVVDPLNPFRALEYFSEFFEKPWQELFGGALMPVPDMPRSYVPTLFALQMPEVFLALALAGIVLAAASAARPGEPRRRAILSLLVVAAVLPVAITVAERPAMYNGIRHFIFVVPPLAALGGLAGGRAFEWLARRGRMAAAAGALVLAGALALPVVEFVRLHPYEYTHFNHLAGGVARRRPALHARLLGSLVQAGGRGAARQRSTQRGEKRRPPTDAGRSPCAGRIRRQAWRSAPPSSRPGTRRARTSP